MTGLFLFFLLCGTSVADNVILDDLIVDGSGCIGMDCVNGESFGFDTLRLKENNMRIHFDDTSSSSSFPSNDWRIVINDSGDGGSNYFAIEDSTNGKVSFKVEANAPTNSLFVEDSGDIGIGTDNPVLELQIKDGDTPALRLEQDNSFGWGAYTWDVAGNETNFFIRDATNGSNIPFKILPGATSNSLCISANSNVGIGIRDATASLHIKKSGLTASNNMLFIQNDTLEALTLDGAGNLTAGGTISHGSSRSIKKEIENVDPDDILERLLQLDIYTWQYKTDDNITHLGPMAEEFGDLFHLGKDNKHIAPGDMGGIAFAAIQSLNDKIEQRDQKISTLEKENADLSDRLDRLESLVESLMDKS